MNNLLNRIFTSMTLFILYLWCDDKSIFIVYIAYSNWFRCND